MWRSAAKMALVVLTLATLGWSQSSEKVIFSFDGDNGRLPDSGLVADARGNLYGTTFDGGANDYGNVFELTPVALGTWRETVLYTFTGGTDGALPESTLVLDSQGNIYGTAQAGGAGQCVSGASGNLGCGVVFKLSKNGNTWQETVLYSFQPGVSKGTIPVGGVIFDNAGNLYGTTWAPGVLGDMVASKAGKSQSNSYWGCTLPGCGGTVYKLTPTQNGWQETDIYAFTGGADGAAPLNNLTIDSAGNLYGTTPYGGSGCQYGCGVVFKLSQSNGNWTETVLHSFAGSDGSAPTGAVTFDQSGNLYSTTSMGGANHQGTVFQLSPNGQQWNETVLHSFTAGNDGANPYAGVVLDSHGNVFGTAAAAGQQLVGTVFRLTPNGGQWQLTVLHTFTRGNGDANSPYGQILFVGKNFLIGTAQGGGQHQVPGAVYQILQPF